MGLKSFSQQKIFGIRRKKQLQALAIQGRAYEETLRQAATVGLDRVIEDRPLMRRLNDGIQENIEAVKRQIIKHRIRLFLCSGDASDYARVFCCAAQSLGVPYVVIAHGYVQHYALLTIAPINADALIVWSEQQADAIRAAVGPTEAGKVHYFGYPKPFWPPSPPASNLVGLVWHPVFHSADRQHEIDQLIQVARQLAAQRFEIIVRLHPKDRADADVTGRLRQMGLTLSDGSIEQELGPASVIVGSRSSVLVEAGLSGKPVFQLQEYRLNHLEAVHQISLDDPAFGELIKASQNRVHDVVPGFDVRAFTRFLADKMGLSERAAA